MMLVRAQGQYTCHMNYVVAPPPVVSLPVAGQAARFPVRRVFCVGRNYAAHVREMGGQPQRDPPVFFCKPADAVVSDNTNVPYPQATSKLHHEVEMVLALGQGGRDLEVAAARELVFACGVGLDLTRRDLQAECKQARAPWDVAKAFDHSAPVSALQPVADGWPAADALLELEVNGEKRQRAPISDMLWPVAELLAALSWLFELRPGDLVFTGTPPGVGPLRRGDAFHASLQGVAELHGRIA